MKRFIPLLAAIVLGTGVLAFTGCATNDNSMPLSDHGATAGGNGAFGESPARPGSYSGDEYNQPASHALAPTTQPARIY